MTTSPRTRKPRAKPERRVNISKPVNGVFALYMTIGQGEKAKSIEVRAKSSAIAPKS